MEGLNISNNKEIKKSPESVGEALPVKVLEHIMFMNPIIVEGGMVTSVYRCQIGSDRYPVFVEIQTFTNAIKKVNIKEINPREDSSASINAVKSLKETYIEKFGV